MSRNTLLTLAIVALIMLQVSVVHTQMREPQKNGYVDLSNPELWVFYSLSNKPETIHRPGTVKKLITQLGQLGNSNSGVSPATGIEFAPWRLTDTATVQSSALGWFNCRNIQFGLATGYDSSGYRSGIGFKWTFFDGSDVRNDEAFMSYVMNEYQNALEDEGLDRLQDKAYDMRKLVKVQHDTMRMIVLSQPSELSRLAKEYGASPDSLLRRMLDTIMRSIPKDSVDEYRQKLYAYEALCIAIYERSRTGRQMRIEAADTRIREQKRLWADSSWNHGYQLTVGIGVNIHSKNGYVSDIQSVRAPLLISMSYGIGQYLQIIASGSYAVSSGSYADSLKNDFSYGAQLIAGTSRVRPYVQLLWGGSRYSIGRGESVDFTLWSAGLDLRIAENLWMNIGGGERREFATSGNITYPLIKYGVRVNFTESE